MFLSKKPVVHTWQGTKVPPRIPTKNRIAYRLAALWAVPASAVGMEPARSREAKVRRGPNLSHIGPATARTTSVAVKEMMLEFATSFCERWRSFLIVRVSRGGNAYHDQNAI